MLTSRKHLSINKFYDKLYYYIGNDSAHYSLDNGNTWYLESPKGRKTFNFNSDAILRLDDKGYLQLNGDKIWFYDKDFFNGVALKHDIPATMIGTLTSYKGVLYTTTTKGRSFQSFDAGRTWVNPPPVFTNFYSIQFHGDSIVAVSAYGKNFFRFLYSFDNGNTWDTTRQGLSFSSNSSPQLIIVKNKLFLKSGTTIYKSYDWGLTWSELYGSEITGSWECMGVTSFRLFNHKNTLYSIGSSAYITRLNDSTEKWEAVKCFGVGGARALTLGDYLTVTTPSGFHYSADDGATWFTPACVGLPRNGSNYKVYPYDLFEIHGTWYASTSIYGLYTSTDLGATWTKVANTIPFDPYFGFTVINNILFIGSRGKGVWKMENPLIETKGRVFRDFNKNGIYDESDYPLSGCMVYTAPGYAATSTDIYGHYILHSRATGDTLRPGGISEFLNSNSAYRIVTESATGQDFGLFTGADKTDLSVNITNHQSFSPGQTTRLSLKVKNEGEAISNATLKLKLSNVAQLISTNPAYSALAGDTVIWNNISLALFGEEIFDADLSISSGSSELDTIKIYAGIYPMENDFNSEDNTYILNDFLSKNSYQNEKRSSYSNNIPLSEIRAQTPIEFTIRFKNSTNTIANSLSIIDTLSPYLDISGLKLISSSHPLTWEVRDNNTLHFKYNGINLPDCESDPLNCRGYVKFSIPCLPYIQTGTLITNQAFISILSDSPIATNKVYNFVSDIPIVLSDKKFIQENNSMGELLSVFPNPTSDMINIVAEHSNGEYIRTVYTLFGKLVDMQSIRIVNDTHNFNVSSFQSGMYLLKLWNKKTQKMMYTKFVKM